MSYAQFSTATTCVFSEWILGLGGRQENQKPATQICHRLRNKAQLSQRGMHPGDPRVRRRAAGARAPFSTLLPLCVGPAERPPPAPPPPSPLPSLAREPAGAGRPRLPATRSLAGLRALRSSPSACPTLAPKSQLRKTSPRAAWKGKGGRRGGRRPGPGFLPLPPPVPNR